jgi:hypothetical protein
VRRTSGRSVRGIVRRELALKALRELRLSERLVLCGQILARCLQKADAGIRLPAQVLVARMRLPLRL